MQETIGRDCSIRVEKFLCLKKVECNFKGMNIIIGPQAEGKSLIAKLVFFFQEFIFNDIFFSLHDDTSCDEIKELALYNFRRYFPGNLWENQSFLIKYVHGPFSIELTNFGGKLEIALNKALTYEIEDAIDTIAIEKSEWMDQFADEVEDAVALGNFDPADFIPDFFYRKLSFVPAQRNLLSTIQKSIFSVIRDQSYIDPLLINYGSSFEAFNNLLRYQRERNNEPSKLMTIISGRLSNVLKGEYLVDENDSSIKTAYGEVKLQYASSGQQEVAPLVPIAGRKISSVFIEEPEAHLYPTSQKEIIELFSSIYNENIGMSFLITTHSPYVLSSLNNLIEASNIAQIKINALSRIETIIPKEKWIPFSDVTAWYINDGSATCITNSDNKLIDANAIDDVSNQLAEEFDALLDIKFEDENDG